MQVFQNELMLGDEFLYLNLMKLEKYHLSFTYIGVHSRAASKHADIEFRRLFVREQANIKQDSIMRFLFHPFFMVLGGGDEGGIGLWGTYLYVILSTAK